MLSENEAYFTIDRIWEDDDLVEVRITASNGRFSGASKCYTNDDQLRYIAEQLTDYPSQPNQIISLTTDPRGDLSHFELKMQSDSVGHILATVKITQTEIYTNAPTKHQEVILQLNVEPASVEKFSKTLLAMSNTQSYELQAILSGSY